MTNAIVPLFCTTRLDATKAFYRKHLGFMAPDGERWQPASGQGLVYCFRVEDADAEHARLAREGVPIVDEPEDKPWGERGFLASDPNGISLYFGHPLGTEVESSAAAK